MPRSRLAARLLTPYARLGPYTLPFNRFGNPAVALQCGFGADGLPNGLQLIGPHLADARLLRAEALFEQAWPCAGERPPKL